MSALLPSFPSLAGGLTTALRIPKLSRQLRPYHRCSSLFHRPCPPNTLPALRGAQLQTVSSQPVWLSWRGSSFSGTRNVSGVRDVSAKTSMTQPASQETQVGREGLQFPLKGREARVPLVWLRDHCRCQACYNPDTFQKNADSYSLKGLSVVQSDVDGDALTVKWQDGHISKFSLQWIADNFYTAGPQAEDFLWDGSRMNNEVVPVTTFDSHMGTEEGLKKTLSNIVKFGFCIVDGAPATAEGTELVTGRISFVQETVYGRVSTMVSGEMTHSDTAYTALALGAHTDLSYFTVPAGIQVFHCLEHEGEGGLTLLVDGFHAAQELRRIEPASFQCLVTTPVPHEYIEGTHYHLYSLGTVLATHPLSGQLTHIRFNPYDRAPLKTVSADSMAQFYSSYEALTRIIRNKSSEFWLKLNPGMVLLVDNWRVMHGRSSFTGRRVLCSAYLPRDDWMSRARVLGSLLERTEKVGSRVESCDWFYNHFTLNCQAVEGLK